MWKSIQHNDQYGPFASDYKNKGEEASTETATATTTPQPEMTTTTPQTAATEGSNIHAVNTAAGLQPYAGT